MLKAYIKENSAQVLTLQIIRAIKLPPNQKRERTTGKKKFKGHGPGRTQCTRLRMYHVSAQGVDERMINVHSSSSSSPLKHRNQRSLVLWLSHIKIKKRREKEKRKKKHQQTNNKVIPWLLLSVPLFLSFCRLCLIILLF